MSSKLFKILLSYVNTNHFYFSLILCPRQLKKYKRLRLIIVVGNRYTDCNVVGGTYCYYHNMVIGDEKQDNYLEAHHASSNNKYYVSIFLSFPCEGDYYYHFFPEKFLRVVSR